MKRYVVQEHEKHGEPVHWDLMLEADGVLETFRLDRPPPEASAAGCRAQKIADHALGFLTYEGPVHQGAGQVRIVESGTYEAGRQTRSSRALTLHGAVFSGRFVLRQGPGEWRFERLTNRRVR